MVVRLICILKNVEEITCSDVVCSICGDNDFGKRFDVSGDFVGGNGFYQSSLCETCKDDFVKQCNHESNLEW